MPVPADEHPMTVFNSPWALLLVLPTLAALTGTVVRNCRAWADREITPALPWTAVTILAATTANATAALLTSSTGPGPAVATAAATFLAVVAICTDLSCRKVPRELPHVAALAGLAMFALHASWAAAISLAVTTVALVVLPWITRALTRAGLGFSDIRILWAFTTTLSWWTGPNIMIWSLLGACLFQLLIRAVAIPLHLGTRVPVPGKDGRTRLELPFAPALCAGFATGTAYAAITGASACAALYAC